MTPKERHLYRTYGITLEQYNTLRRKQRYSCAVCRKHEKLFNKALAVDHDHKTGEIYGLLCYTCNHRVIGNIRDPVVYKNAARYLAKGTGWFIPPKKKRKKKK